MYPKDKEICRSPLPAGEWVVVGARHAGEWGFWHLKNAAFAALFFARMAGSYSSLSVNLVVFADIDQENLVALDQELDNDSVTDVDGNR